MQQTRFYGRPEKEEPSPKRRRLVLLLNTILFIAVCWALTLTFGVWGLRPELRVLESRYERGFQQSDTCIRSPFPFILTIRIEGETVREGVSAYRSIYRYYIWFFQFKKEIPVESAPFILKWVWLF